MDICVMYMLEYEYAILKGQFLPPKALCFHFFLLVNYILLS